MRVLHIGAGTIDDEIRDYQRCGVTDITYVECEEELINKCLVQFQLLRDECLNIEGRVIPYACSEYSWEKKIFYTNGFGQSSCKKPTDLTKSWAKSKDFQIKEVYTINIAKLKSKDPYDFLSIDIQGGELDLLRGLKDFELKTLSQIVDIEIQTTNMQYDVTEKASKEIETILENQGFIPLIHGCGLTESFIFVHKSLLLNNYIKFRNIVKHAISENNLLVLHPNIGRLGSIHEDNAENILKNRENFLISNFTPGLIKGSHYPRIRDKLIQLILKDISRSQNENKK
ncbi:hypothetical protein Syncc9902_0086 [Synechococcus sp. CC9902]|nr:hypothetical protein Syncc9902_0086 [Synechococcus sp. CC9902]